MASGFSAEEVATMPLEALHDLASEIMPQSLHLRRLLSDALSDTWAATQGVQEVAATRRGSKAGEPLADLVFGIIMHRILQRVRDRMDDQGLLARLPVCGAIPLRLLTMCFLKWVLNCAAGKSECLMTLRGKGVKSCARASVCG